MAQVIADRRDIDFVLYEQLQIEFLFKTKQFSDLNRKMLDMVISEAKNLGIKEILPTYAEGDRRALGSTMARYAYRSAFTVRINCLLKANGSPWPKIRKSVGRDYHGLLNRPLMNIFSVPTMALRLLLPWVTEREILSSNSVRPNKKSSF